MLRKFLLPAAIGFSAYFLYEKYLSNQNKELLFRKLCRKLSKKVEEGKEAEGKEAEAKEREGRDKKSIDKYENKPETNDTQENPISHVLQTSINQIEETVKTALQPEEKIGSTEEGTSIIEQNKLLQSMFDFIQKK